MNRESYLMQCVELLKTSVFAGYSLPIVNVSCSWPGGASPTKAIGQCWSRAASDAGINEIFISPMIEESTRAMDILCHELIHALDDCQHGHKKEFSQIANDIGLAGKPTATYCEEGSRLHAQLKEIRETLGEYPHAKLNPPGPKQKSRQLKASCDCGAVWRMSAKWLELAVCCPVCKSEEITID